jgi:zinc and cadmium transporter
MPTLALIVFATLAGGILSMAAAALFAMGVPNRWLPRLTGFSAGVLLAAALLDLLPEASTELEPQALFVTLLAGLLGFFVIERIALWRHDHQLDGGAVTGRLVLLGDAFHNYVDGVLLAAAFLTSPTVGWAATLAVIAHEIPQEAGDFLLLRLSGYSKARAFFYNALSSLAAVAGGVAGYFLLEDAHAALPYALALAAASFLYIAVADLMPFLHRQRGTAAALWQGALMAAGVAIIPLAGHFVRMH